MKWIDLFKEHDTSILYHLGKSNVVADSLSRMSIGSIAHIEDSKKDLLLKVHHLDRLRVRLFDSFKGNILDENGSKTMFIFEVKLNKNSEPILFKLKEEV